MADDPYFSSPQYKELCRLFREQLPPRLVEIKETWRRAAGGRGGAEVRGALRALATQLHQLSGTAASFGCPALGGDARALEEALHALAGRGRDLEAAEKAEIEGRIDALVATAQAEAGRAEES
ncbi:MAG: Hpt domain-containing protein [Proteobacteria bacterium]|nr:Hpt domain-containing protein [Pseudomonadota bacterium]